MHKPQEAAEMYKIKKTPSYAYSLVKIARERRFSGEPSCLQAVCSYRDGACVKCQPCWGECLVKQLPLCTWVTPSKTFLFCTFVSGPNRLTPSINSILMELSLVSTINALSGEMRCLLMYTQEKSPSITIIIFLMAAIHLQEKIFLHLISYPEIFLILKIIIQQNFITNLGSNLDLMGKKINCSWLLPGLYNLCPFVSLTVFVR